MATTLSESDERKLVKKYGLAQCPTQGAAGIHTRAVVAIDDSTGKRRLVRQCPDCGWTWPASGSIGDHKTAPNVNVTAASLRAAEVQAAQDRRNAGIKQRFAIAKASKPAADREFFTWYSQYLHSSAWKARRMAVLERDGNRCQVMLHGCTTRAAHVHHRSYSMMRMGDFDRHQPLFDLISACASCHEGLHADDPDYQDRKRRGA